MIFRWYEYEHERELRKSSEKFSQQMRDNPVSNVMITFVVIISFSIALYFVFKEDVLQTNTLKIDTTIIQEKKMNLVTWEIDSTQNNDTKSNTTDLSKKKWKLKIVDGHWIIDSTNIDYGEQNQKVALTQKIDSINTDTILSILRRHQLDKQDCDDDDDDFYKRRSEKNGKNIPYLTISAKVYHPFRSKVYHLFRSKVYQ